MQGTLDDHRLRYLFEAVRHGSLRAAADALDINASVISRQVAQLERDLGLSLIERLGRGIRPTEAGALLVQKFRQWAADREDVLARLRELQGLQRGHIDLVLGEGFVSDLMAGPLHDFWSRHPGLTLSLDLAGTNEVIRAVSEDRCHIGLVYNAGADPRIRVRAAIRQPIRAILRPEDPRAVAGRALTLAELAGAPLGLMHPGYGTRQVIATAEAAEHVSLAPKLTTSSIHVLRHFVKSGLGITLLPAFSVAADLADGSLVAVPVAHPLLDAAEACVITRHGRELPGAAAGLLRFLTAHMRAFRDRAAS